MLVGCCWDALSGIGSIVQAWVAIALFVIAKREGKKAYQQWNDERTVQRSKFLESLLDKFSNDNVQQLVMLADDSSVAQKWLNKVSNDSQKEMEAQSSFRFFAYLCYLMDNKLITENEFGLFEGALKGILSNEQVQEYFRIMMKRSGNGEMQFKSLFDYAARHHIDLSVTKNDTDHLEEVVHSATATETHGGGSAVDATNSTRPPLTVEELSKYPVAIIRINRLYRTDMKPDELYDATRGWWRVNLEIARKAQYALSVAENRVKEVYEIKGWHKYGSNTQGVDDGVDGRYQFDGEPVKDEAIRRLYFDRSIQGVFRQGDAYPVRYFGVK